MQKSILDAEARAHKAAVLRSWRANCEFKLYYKGFAVIVARDGDSVSIFRRDITSFWMASSVEFACLLIDEILKHGEAVAATNLASFRRSNVGGSTCGGRARRKNHRPRLQ